MRRQKYEEANHLPQITNMQQHKKLVNLSNQMNPNADTVLQLEAILKYVTCKAFFFLNHIF